MYYIIFFILPLFLSKHTEYNVQFAKSKTFVDQKIEESSNCIFDQSQLDFGEDFSFHMEKNFTNETLQKSLKCSGVTSERNWNFDFHYTLFSEVIWDYKIFTFHLSYINLDVPDFSSYYLGLANEVFDNIIGFKINKVEDNIVIGGKFPSDKFQQRGEDIDKTVSLENFKDTVFIISCYQYYVSFEVLQNQKQKFFLDIDLIAIYGWDGITVESHAELNTNMSVFAAVDMVESTNNDFQYWENLDQIEVFNISSVFFFRKEPLFH